MQSGISASHELKTAFKGLLASSSNRGLVVKISSSPESLVPVTEVPSSGSFTSDLSSVAPVLAEDAAAYVLLRVDQPAGKCVAVTYVPDRAPVRQKMLFASTRLTLVRELGTEHFTSTLFATTKDELTVAGWAKHEAHGNLSAPLTEEEKSLEGIREAEAQESMGTSTRRGHVSKGVSLPLGNGVEDALEKLKTGVLGLVQLAIDLSTETLTLASTTPSSSCSPSTLAGTISKDAPRYSIYAHKSDSVAESIFLFIYTCPTASSVKDRMIYATCRNSMIHFTLPDAGLTNLKRLEATIPDDISEKDVLQEVEPGTSSQEPNATSAASSRGFARPKRPGKK